MLSLYRKIDQAVVEGTQVAYLWLLDRTGVYAATIMFFATSMTVVLSMIAADRGARIFDFFAVAFFGLTTVAAYRWQDRKMFDRYNINALSWRDGNLRHFLVCGWMLCALYDAVHGPRLGIVICFLWMTWNFLACVLIRDREPPPRHEMKLATENT